MFEKIGMFFVWVAVLVALWVLIRKRSNLYQGCTC